MIFSKNTKSKPLGAKENANFFFRFLFFKMILTKKTGQVLFLSVAALAVNLLGLFVGKLVLDKTVMVFPATLPFVASTTMMVILFVVYMFIESRHRYDHLCWEYWMNARAFGFLFGVMLSVSVLSVAVQDLSTKEIVESLQPLVMLLSYVFYEKRSISTRQCCCVIFTVCGVLCTIENTSSVRLLGICYSTFMIITSTMVTSIASSTCSTYNVDTLSFVAHASPYTVAATMPLAVWLEGETFVNFAFEHPLNVGLCVACSGLLMTAYHLLHVALIKITSSIYVGMVMALKMNIAIVLSIIFIEHTHTSALRWIGIVVTCMGFVSFQVVK